MRARVEGGGRRLDGGGVTGGREAGMAATRQANSRILAMAATRSSGPKYSVRMGRCA